METLEIRKNGIKIGITNYLIAFFQAERYFGLHQWCHRVYGTGAPYYWDFCQELCRQNSLQ
jgi:hypothetical protein